MTKYIRHIGVVGKSLSGMTRFRDYLNEELKDLEFKAKWDQLDYSYEDLYSQSELNKVKKTEIDIFNSINGNTYGDDIR